MVTLDKTNVKLLFTLMQQFPGGQSIFPTVCHNDGFQIEVLLPPSN